MCKLYKPTLLFGATMLLVLLTSAQRVDNKKCPDQYFRNNGNGQAVEIFASNVSTSSIYYQTALKNGNQGNFTFKWGVGIVHPPVITKTWVTSTSGVTTQNWIFGNNLTGSPFNPPGVPDAGNVKYTFYNANLPTAGVITLELSDPFDGSYLNTCSYPLNSGASSTGILTNFAIAAPSEFNYAISNVVSAAGVAGSSEAPTVNAAGGVISYSMTPQIPGVSIHTNTGVISWNANVAIGTHQFTCIASNGIQPDANTSFTLTISADGVSSGMEGGLESRSLGNAVAVRAFQNIQHGKSAMMDYPSLPLLQDQVVLATTVNQSGIYTVSGNTPPVSNSLFSSIKALMPDQQVLGNGYTGFITTPTDLLSFTNAKEVVSVDYVENGLNKAVAFCTKTTGGIYTHTKPVCDRLKGATLMKVDTIRRNNYTLLRYHLQPASGLPEYAVSFSVGYNLLDSNFTLQSEWTTDRYAAQEVMYNFQLWSADPKVLMTMVDNVLHKIRSIATVVQVGKVQTPNTYITTAKRDPKNQHNLQLTIQNNQVEKTALIQVVGKANEQSVSSNAKSYVVSIAPNQSSTVSVPLKDVAEAEITLLMNGKQEDFVYSNDGVWNLYQTPSTQITSFHISNDTIQPVQDEFRLFRNVTLKATTSDYITVYRMAKGGGTPADLSKYSSLKFTASGNGKVRIRLMKKSIINFNDQYTYELSLSNQEKEYVIDLASFTSKGNSSPIVLSDLVIVSFTYEVTQPNTAVNASIQALRFAQSNQVIAVEEKSLQAFPNPARKQVQISYVSAYQEQMTMQLIHLSTGRVYQQNTLAVKQGMNQHTVLIPEAAPAAIYLMRLQSARQSFQTKLITLH